LSFILFLLLNHIKRFFNFVYQRNILFIFINVIIIRIDHILQKKYSIYTTRIIFEIEEFFRLIQGNFVLRSFKFLSFIFYFFKLKFSLKIIFQNFGVTICTKIYRRNFTTMLTVKRFNRVLKLFFTLDTNPERILISILKIQSFLMFSAEYLVIFWKNLFRNNSDLFFRWISF